LKVRVIEIESFFLLMQCPDGSKAVRKLVNKQKAARKGAKLQSSAKKLKRFHFAFLCAFASGC
ncbi:MAG: hypothetical protein ACRD2G_19430, partial [Terriglobia bacterium]